MSIELTTKTLFLQTKLFDFFKGNTYLPQTIELRTAEDFFGTNPKGELYMKQEFSDRFEDFHDAEIEASVLRFEEMLKNKDNRFFDEETFEQLSEHYLSKNNWEMAQKACDIGLEQYPYSLELLLNKAQLQVNYGHFNDALGLLDKAATFNPSDPEIGYMQGVIYNLTGEYERAIELFRDTLLVSDEKENIYFQIAQTYQNWQKFEEAVRFYKKAIKFNINNEIAFYELAFCLDQIGELESSVSYFQGLVDDDPYSYYAWFSLGIVYSHLAKYEDAATAYDYAVTIKETFASGWFNLGNTYMNLENFKDAKNCYENTLKYEEPTAEVYTHLGASCEKLELYEEGLKHYKEAVKLDEMWDDAWFGIGSCLYELDKWMEAVHFTKKAIKLNEANADYWLLLADTESKIGNVLSSIEAYNQANLLDAQNPDISLNWSLLYFEQGEYNKAFETVYDALSEMPDEVDLYYRAAIYLIFDGSYNEAYHYLETALLLNYEGHTQIYDFFPNLDTQKALFRIIEQYRK